jgi:hypothetical protein
VTIAPAALVASAVSGDGTVRTGAVLSWTVTVNVRLAALPLASVAVQVTVVAPMANVPPEAGVQIGVIEPLTRSVADAL